MGGDLFLFLGHHGLLSFNPRPHMGGDFSRPAYVYAHVGFNPRPHMGGDERENVEYLTEDVSIHAPTWGAT